MIDTELVPREVPGYRSTRMEFGDLFGHAIGFKLLENGKWGGVACAWVAQLVQPPTLGFVPGHDLRVMRLSLE